MAGSNMPAKIILLNGAGSAGKSSIARALQEIATAPFLHVEMDVFLAMVPEALQDHPDGLSFETKLEDDRPSVFAKTGPVAERVLSGMRRSVAELARAGNNLIVDDVLFGNAGVHGDTFADYQSLLAPHVFHIVGVFAPLEVLEARERRRGDRLVGLARWQHTRVHEGFTYDLSVDAGTASPGDCARVIKETFGL
ncbi:MAG: chloramphenicol phosphotransferase [Pseudomonadota bacterium]